MKRRLFDCFCLLTLASAGSIPTNPVAGAEPPTAKAREPVRGAAHAEAAPLPPAMRRLHVSARSGAEWLVRIDNPVNGRFMPGWLPALNAPLDEDNYLFQAGAAYALARAARYYSDERYLMKARQATLSLLAETQLDPENPTCRVTTLPTMVVNRLAAAGALLLVIHELSDPAEELLKHGEELCHYIRTQQQADGSFAAGAIQHAGVDAGLALRGLLLSQRHRPAKWKTEAATKALSVCRKQWQIAPSLSLAAALAPAFAEAYVLTKEAAFADFVFEMSDWVCAAQYRTDASRPTWVGGFKPVEQGKSVLRAPDITGAANVEGLAAACLVARFVKNGERWARYREAADLGAQFLVSLQYTETNTMHFTPGYRPALIGGFHASLHDGNLRLDYNQHAILAMIQRLTWVGDR